MAGSIEDAREAGYTDSEINDYLAPRMLKARAAGYTEDEINQYLNIKPAPPFNDDAVRKPLEERLKAHPKPVQSFTDALEAGWQISTAGLVARGAPPSKQVAEDAPWTSRIAGQAATMAGDLPAMFGGAVLGGATAPATGPAAPMMAAAGAFALPSALRATLMDSYEKGQFQTFSDFWDRASGIFIDTAKGYVTGLATGGAGVAAKAVLPSTLSPSIAAVTKTAAEVATMVTVGKGLEGEVPSAQDFMDGAILLGGLHVATSGAGKLRQIYSKTGVPPNAVVADAQSDVTVQQDFLSRKIVPEIYAEGEVKPETTPEPLPAELPKTELPTEPGTGPTPQQIILDHISVGEKDPVRAGSWSRLYTDTIDRLFPIWAAARDAAKEKGIGNMPANLDPGKLARNYAGVSGVATRALEFNTIDFATREPNGASLKDVLAPVQNDLNGFRAFVASRHAIDLESQGIKTGFDMNAAEAVVAQGREIYGATADAFTEYSNRVAAYARDAGVISRDGYTEMVQKHLFYIPMQRVMEADPAAARSGSGGTLQAQNPLRRIEGSTRQIVDPIESVIRNTFLMTQMAERNNVGRALIALLGGTERAVPTTSDQPTKAKLAALLREHGVDLPESMASLADGLQPVRDGEIRIMTDGKPETYLVDPELARSFKNLDQETANLLVQLLGAPARTLRAGATLTPDFVARNLIRDLSGAALYTGKGLFSPIDTMKGLIGAVRKDADYQRWISEGGASASMVSLDRNYLQTSIEKLTQETGLATRAWNVIRHPVDTLRAVSELAEEATRLGEFKGVYKRMVEEGASPQEAGKEAAYSSREVTLDFARMGAKIKAMNMITAFFNAQVQGVDRFVRAARDNPGPLAIKTLAGITMPSMLLWWANHEDPRYNEIPNWQKDLFWIVMTKDTIYRIPKPFEVGIIFGSGVERALDAFVADKPDAFKGYGGSLMGGLLPSFVPTAALPLVEQFANRSTFSDRTLVPDQAEKLLPEYQYTPYTTETAKALGKLMGAFPGMRDQSLEHGTGGAVARALTSPILLENYLRAWTGNMGVYALALVDKGLRTAGVVPSPVKPDDTLADVPFVKAFVVRYPSASAQSLQDFRDSYDKNKVYFDTWMAMARSGDLAAAQHVQEIGGPGMMLQLSAIKETISEHANLVRGIYTNPDISSGEKRQLIDTMYWRMIELAQIGNKANREISAQMEGKTK